ncbi:aspartate/glutamate racemase family protein [Flagellimonas hymeniacidonis]|uniref:Aspartate/glutamate racemase family protein n=1 Tax=Flagellimonas hymeniacidonis TaxID=2603628 RepID=A0A5C8V742_9FLAO|nr:aspartate/glutamate racemase family protein [Flagellimonas hymeniacidonis]TXN37934.1 aspartate/glutamate racemase family protein [Flagellimonas hymeniacidonis]
MKTIGLIGGMSWESSKIYYQHINEMIKEKLGGSHSAKSILTSVDFEEIERFSFSGDWDKVGEIMALHAEKLEKAGADFAILCTNTIHLVSKDITNAVDIPFLHIAHATGEAIAKSGLQKVALLGTRFTMEKDFYTKILQDEFGLEILVPNTDDMDVLQSIIYNELVKGIFTIESKNRCLEIIKKLKTQGAQGVILGCTELPMLIPSDEVGLPSFDTTKIHAQKAVDFATS